MGTLMVYGIFHPNKIMFPKCWASPIQLCIVRNCLATERMSATQPWRKCAWKGRRRCIQSSGSVLCPAALWAHPTERGAKAHAKTHLSALKWTAKGQLRIQDLKHTLEWVFLSSSVLSGTAGEEWCVLVCCVCTGPAHSPALNHNLLWSGRGMPLNWMHVCTESLWSVLHTSKL